MSSCDSDVDETSFVPSASECQRRIDAFVSVTETDEAFAQMLLQRHKWDLKEAVEAHFGGGAPDGQGEGTAAQESTTEPGTSASSSTSTFNTQAPEDLLYLTWNIDGLAEKNLVIRTKAVSKIIQQRKPDIVCLQEVVPDTYKYLQKKLPEYQFVCQDPEADYFVAVLLRRFTIYLDSFQTIGFPGSRMGRNLLTVECHVGKFRLTVLTTHLESTKEHADERMRQLRVCLKQMRVGEDGEAERTVILGGDLNMRDKELEEVGGLPSGVVDAWQQMGSKKETMYTWDMVRNSNLEFPGRFKPRCRFDRVYVRGTRPSKATLLHFGLVGIERIRQAQCFPSDHWGIMCAFKVKSND